MKITNRRAFHDYQVLEKLEVGINLIGPEVKSVKNGHADLTGSFVRIIGSEAYLVNAKIFPYEYARPEGYDEKRTRKLLLHKKEIIALKSRMEGANLTVIPLSMYTKKGLIKLQLALARGKRQYEKRQAIRKRDLAREEEVSASTILDKDNSV